jgi:hypothetical protein
MSDVTRTARKFRLSEQDQDDDLRATTPEQRIEMMWQLAVDAWTMAGVPIEPFRRDVVRIIRGKEAN